MKEDYLEMDELDGFSKKVLEAVRPYERDYGFQFRKEELALLIIDMQRYFLDPAAHGYVPSARAVMPNIRRLQGFFLDNNMPVYLTKHINDQDNAGMMGIRWKEVITAEHPYADIVEELKMPGCRVIPKTQFDAFYQSGLEEELKTRGISQLVICGVMANLCCETTVRSAFVRGFEPLMPVDATAAYNSEFHLATFSNLAYGFMQPMSTDQVLDKLNK